MTLAYLIVPDEALPFGVIAGAFSKLKLCRLLVERSIAQAWAIFVLRDAKLGIFLMTIMYKQMR
jgi:hypothetical protein